MQKHESKIMVRKLGEKPIGTAEFKKLSWIKRLTLKWFGKAERVMTIVPQDNVRKVEIKEV